MCFQILGFDILIDHKLTPYLLEINQTPSFATDSTLDWTLKLGLIANTLQLLCINSKRRKEYEKDRARKITERLQMPTKQPVIDPEMLKQLDPEGKGNQNKLPGTDEKEAKKLMKKLQKLEKIKEKKKRAI